MSRDVQGGNQISSLDGIAFPKCLKLLDAVSHVDFAYCIVTVYFNEAQAVNEIKSIQKVQFPTELTALRLVSS